MSLRQTIDANLIRSIALPAAGAVAYTDSIDLGTGPHTEKIELRIELPATPALVKGKTITLAVQDSPDDVTYTDVEELASVVVTGGDPTAGLAALREVHLPSTADRYIRLRASVLAAGGDNTAIAATLSPLL